MWIAQLEKNGPMTPTTSLGGDIGPAAATALGGRGHFARGHAVARHVADAEAARAELPLFQHEPHGSRALQPVRGEHALQRQVGGDQDVGLTAVARVDLRARLERRGWAAPARPAGGSRVVAAARRRRARRAARAGKPRRSLLLPAAVAEPVARPHRAPRRPRRRAACGRPRRSATSSVTASTRASVPSSFATHTARASAASCAGTRSTPILTVPTTPRVRGSTLVTAPVLPLSTQTKSPPAAIARGKPTSRSAPPTSGSRRSPAGCRVDAQDLGRLAADGPHGARAGGHADERAPDRDRLDRPAVGRVDTQQPRRPSVTHTPFSPTATDVGSNPWRSGGASPEGVKRDVARSRP